MPFFYYPPTSIAGFIPEPHTAFIMSTTIYAVPPIVPAQKSFISIAVTSTLYFVTSIATVIMKVRIVARSINLCNVFTKYHPTSVTSLTSVI